MHTINQLNSALTGRYTVTRELGAGGMATVYLAPDVGKALGVGAIVEGTVRRTGDRIRLTAQLTSTRDGQVLWSDAFERTGADVFAVQDAFTSAIVAALTPRLGNAAGTGSAATLTGGAPRADGQRSPWRT